MGQVLHGCATTTEAIRRAIQNSQESRVRLKRLFGEGIICLIVREPLEAAGIDPANYSGHSLRLGLATSAACPSSGPQLRQRRRCTHELSIFRHSSHPRALGVTRLIAITWIHPAIIIHPVLPALSANLQDDRTIGNSCAILT
jgi:hypothetical protein